MQTRRTTLQLPLYALLLLLACACAAEAQLRPEAPLPAPTGFGKYVTDEANVIDPQTRERLSTILNRLKERADIEFAVVTVPTTGETPIFDYALALARGWGIGAKEGERNGLLLLVAVNDKKYQVQVSRHLEGDMPDALAGEIARQRLRGPFQQGNYSQGISDFVQAVIATLAEKRGFSIEGIDQSYAYSAPSPRVPRGRSDGQLAGGLSPGMCCLLAFIAIIVISMLSGGRRGGRGGGSGCLNALLLANLFSNLGGRGGGSGWGGGGSGWGSGGGGGGFGGFGGGGDFGGGGAGGSW